MYNRIYIIDLQDASQLRLLLEMKYNKNFDKFEVLFVSMDVFRDIQILKISLMNMKIFIFMFESLISNNKEQINIPPSPQGTPLAKIILLNFFE